MIVQEFPKTLCTSYPQTCSSNAHSAEPLANQHRFWAAGCISAESWDDYVRSSRSRVVKSRLGQGPIVAHCHTCQGENNALDSRIFRIQRYPPGLSGIESGQLEKSKWQ